jgi:hypothetical protein
MANLDFSAALLQLKAGQKIARAGWNGKGMFLVLVYPDEYAVHGVPAVAGKKLLPWIGMKTAQDDFVPWLASQTDVLAGDWQVVGA